MATEALQELLRRLNIEQSDCLDKTEWVKLCSQDTINISSELAGAVFDGLDNDADGQVCISDIMKEIKAFEAAAEVNSIPRTPDPRTSSTDSNAPMRTTPSPVPNFKGPRFRLPEVRESRRKGRVFGRGTFSRQSPTIHLNDSGDSFITKKELGEDGSEVFCTTPAPITPRSAFPSNDRLLVFNAPKFNLSRLYKLIVHVATLNRSLPAGIDALKLSAVRSSVHTRCVLFAYLIQIVCVLL
ncbi:unnamed protein product [Dicrocoelium dendriticum]|nr:unnamed protein product [Dicrocoelium dendriticum]